MNYADLFRMTLPETALEIAALVVLVVDLGFLRRATLRVRIFVASILGVFGCGAAIVAMTFQPPEGLGYPGSTDLLLVSGGYAAAAQAGILVLTVFTLFLFIEIGFYAPRRRVCGRYIDGCYGRIVDCGCAGSAGDLRWA